MVYQEQRNIVFAVVGRGFGIWKKEIIFVLVWGSGCGVLEKIRPLFLSPYWQWCDSRRNDKTNAIFNQRRQAEKDNDLKHVVSWKPDWIEEFWLQSIRQLLCVKEEWLSYTVSGWWNNDGVAVLASSRMIIGRKRKKETMTHHTSFFWGVLATV